jgi:hypothetical protein
MVHIRNGRNLALVKMHSQVLKADSLPAMAILKKGAASWAASGGACKRWAQQAAAGTATAAAELCEGGLLVFVIRGTATPYEWTLGEAAERLNWAAGMHACMCAPAAPAAAATTRFFA